MASPPDPTTDTTMKKEKPPMDVPNLGSSISNASDLTSNNGKRKRRNTSLVPVCPVCGLTLRFGEIKEHFEKELSNLEDLSNPSSKSSMKFHKRLNSLSSKKTKKQSCSSRENEEDEEEDQRSKDSEKRLEEFAKIKESRRLRYAKMLLGKWSFTGYDLNDPSVYHLLKCPVCETPIEGNEDELTRHVQSCLRRKEGDADTDEESDGESLDEYTWAGQTRIRVTSLLEPGVYACDGDPIKLEMTNEDEELDIECDEQTQFGQTQYTEKDVIPCNSDIPEENEALGRIRAAILSSEQTSTVSNDSTRSRWSDNEGRCNGENEDILDKNEDIEDVNDGSLIIKSLKKRICCLSDELQKEKQRCLICMEGFDTPLVSIICWHVYCEECWLRTLGAKKLCPQCNTITSPSDLRKIYI